MKSGKIYAKLVLVVVAVAVAGAALASNMAFKFNALVLHNPGDGGTCVGTTCANWDIATRLSVRSSASRRPLATGYIETKYQSTHRRGPREDLTSTRRGQRESRRTDSDGCCDAAALGSWVTMTPSAESTPTGR